MSGLVLRRALQRRIVPAIFARSYHPASSEYLKPTKVKPLTYTMDSLEAKLLSHCLEHNVPQLGFTEGAITQALRDLNQSPSVLSALGASNSPSFVHGSLAVMELFKFDLVSKRYNLTSALENAETLPSLETLLLKRLEMDIPIGKQLYDQFAFLSMPSGYQLDVALPELARLADDMIYFSNEKDHTDMAWYAKRFGVAYSFITSKLYMAQDTSDGYSKTMDFAREKLYDVMKLGDYYNNVEEYLWFCLMTSANLFKAVLSKK